MTSGSVFVLVCLMAVVSSNKLQKQFKAYVATHVEKAFASGKALDDVMGVTILLGKGRKVSLRLVRDKMLSLDTPVFLAEKDGLVEAPAHDMQDSGMYTDKSYSASMAVTATTVGKELYGTLVVDGKEYGVESDVRAASNLRLQRILGLNRGLLHNVYELEKLVNIDKGAKTRSKSSSRSKLSKLLNLLQLAKGKASSPTGMRNYFVEINHILDNSMWQHWRSQVNSDSDAIVKLKLMRTQAALTIKMAYASIPSSFQFTVTPLLKKFIIVKDQSSALGQIAQSRTFDYQGTQTINFGAILEDIPTWNKAQGYNYNNPDVTLWWTRLSAVSSQRADGDPVAGLASMCGVCVPGQGVGAVQETGLNSWRTAAHELAHVLGSEHDGEANTPGSSCPASQGYFMGDDLGANANHHSMSPCSIMMIRDCLGGGDANQDGVIYPRVCLLNRVCDYTSVQINPGVSYTPDQQCKIAKSSYSFCGDATQGTQVCGRLQCCQADGTVFDDESLEAMDGTPCGPGLAKWCKAGECVDSTSSSSAPACVGMGVSTTVPAGCKDDQYTNCVGITEDPTDCFRPDRASACCATCRRAGLYDPFNTGAGANQVVLDPSPAGGQWGGWGSWGACSSYCGDGVWTRSRTCPGGRSCSPGPETEEGQCTMPACGSEACAVDEWQCTGSSQCIPADYWCDGGTPDCDNGADEQGCK